MTFYQLEQASFTTLEYERFLNLLFSGERLEVNPE